MSSLEEELLQDFDPAAIFNLILTDEDWSHSQISGYTLVTSPRNDTWTYDNSEEEFLRTEKFIEEQVRDNEQFQELQQEVEDRVAEKDNLLYLRPSTTGSSLLYSRDQDVETIGVAANGEGYALGKTRRSNDIETYLVTHTQNKDGTTYSTIIDEISVTSNESFTMRKNRGDLVETLYERVFSEHSDEGRELKDTLSDAYQLRH